MGALRRPTAWLGYEPEEMSRRLKLLFLVRLIPLAERNYNLVELGPHGTGKSYVVREVSPYTALLTGGTTVANLFGHMSGRQKGMVQIWDVVGFDEVADLQKMPKEVITTMKTYCESGTFQRGQESGRDGHQGDARVSSVFFLKPVKGRAAGLAKMRELLFNSKESNQRPGMRVSNLCEGWWETVPVLPSDPHRPDIPDTSANDHFYDASAYAATHEPLVMRVRPAIGTN
jgi:predicted ATP-dependent Lon-type protease